MRCFAIGDVQGCYRQLKELLKLIGFRAGHDRLWFVGDLVNRGPDSANVVRLIRDLGDDAISVLGNHDLHLLAVAHGYSKPRAKDTLTALLDAKDSDDLIDWFHDRPLIYRDTNVNAILVHAGVYPGWSTDTAVALAEEVETIIRSRDTARLFSAMYGDDSGPWTMALTGAVRRRFVINVFTRMRMLQSNMALDFRHKGPPSAATAGLKPWFDFVPNETRSERIVFGHWSALGAGEFNNTVSLDSGCVWKNALTAARLDSKRCEFSSVSCT